MKNAFCLNKKVKSFWIRIKDLLLWMMSLLREQRLTPVQKYWSRQISVEFPLPPWDTDETIVLMAFFSKPKYSKVSVKSREGVPKGVWTKCPETGDMVFAKELKKNLMVVPSSGYHFPLSAPDRIESLIDPQTSLSMMLICVRSIP